MFQDNRPTSIEQGFFRLRVFYDLPTSPVFGRAAVADSRTGHHRLSSTTPLAAQNRGNHAVLRRRHNQVSNTTKVNTSGTSAMLKNLSRRPSASISALSW